MGLFFNISKKSLKWVSVSVKMKLNLSTPSPGLYYGHVSCMHHIVVDVLLFSEQVEYISNINKTNKNNKKNNTNVGPLLKLKVLNRPYSWYNVYNYGTGLRKQTDTAYHDHIPDEVH